MFGLRQKLLLGFGGLVLILIVVSAVGIGVLNQSRNAMDRFLYENWRSVEYGREMIGAIADLNAAAKTVQDYGPTSPQAEAARADAAKAVALFERNLDAEHHNVTLPGEDKLAADLSDTWFSPDGYKSVHARAMDASAPADERLRAMAQLQTLASRIDKSADAVVKLNFDNMTPIEGRAKVMADNTTRLMILLSVAGAAIAVLFVAVMGRSILQPIRTLTQSAREIEQGNLDLVVQVHSRDELHDLAEAFNSMAQKLREYRRTNRARLVRTQQTTQNAINSLPDAVAILSPEGQVEMANVAAQNLFGLRPDVHVKELRIQWLNELYKQTAEELRAFEPRGYESAIQVLDEHGGEKFFLPHAVPIIDADDQLLGVTVVLADVTHLRRLDEMKSGMLSVVSHELKTPLTSIRMGVHLMLEERIGSLTAEQGQILSAMRDDSDRLQRIVEGLLDIGRIESGRALMELKPEHVEPLVSEAVEAVDAAYRDKGVKLSVDLPADVPDVLADRTRIGLVFSNLLSNALKYTPAGGEVKITAVASDDEVRFSIADGGPGIAKPYQARVFERFFRVPGQGGNGAGLGLAIAKEIVDAHGGQIGLESTEGEGSTFSFTLSRPDEREPQPVTRASDEVKS